MTFLMKQFLDLVKILHSENGEKQIAVGLALGSLIGFAPALSIQTLVFIFIALVFRINFGAALLSSIFFKFIAYLVDAPADKIGRLLLESTTLRDFWTYLYNIPVLPMTRFNNSVILGCLVISIVTFPIFYFLFLFLVRRYRLSVQEKFEKSHVWKLVKATKFYTWYKKYDDITS